MIVDIDENNFDEIISRGLNIVIFSAKWCSYCQKQYEVLKELKDVKFLKVDGDNNPDLVTRFGVMGFPTFILFKDGKELSKFSGLKNKFELMNILTEYI